MTYTTDITPSQLKNLSNLIYRECGIVIGEKKLALLRARIAKRIRITRTENISEYLKLLSQSHTEFLSFIDAITTNHTYFFRENKHCEFLVKHLDASQPIKIWSAASSSGEEPYSIAAQLLDANFRFSIFASDISDTMLKIARQGIYPRERLKTFPHPSLSKYFQKGRGKWENSIRVKPETQRHVSFDKFNLISDHPSQQFDIIFCRNVMIYFDNATRQHVVDNLLSALKPGGYFFVGMSESLNGINHPMSHVIPSAYQKK
ncbi:CheR family methyltransferase [Desulfocicer niacini]